MIISNEILENDDFVAFNIYENYEPFHIYYEEHTNMFYFDGGYVNHNIYDIMTPNEVYLFKMKKEDMLVYTSGGDVYEIHYEDNEIYEIYSEETDCNK